MASFRFRLGRVLGVRRIQEELARAEFMEKERVARSAEAKRSEARDAVSQSMRELARLLESRVLDPDAILVEQFAVDQTRLRVPPAARRAELARAAAERERSAWQERRAALESLEHLRERSLAAFRAEHERVENARLDELALIRAGRAAKAQNLSAETAEKTSRSVNDP